MTPSLGAAVQSARYREAEPIANPPSVGKGRVADERVWHLRQFPGGRCLLRPARQAEAALLTELAQRSKGHWGYDAAFLAACRDELTIEAAQCDGVHVIVAERAGRVGGYYRLAGEPPRGELSDLFVDPLAIGLGMGGASAARRAGPRALPRLRTAHHRCGPVCRGVLCTRGRCTERGNPQRIDPRPDASSARIGGGNWLMSRYRRSRECLNSRISGGASV